VEEVGKGGVNVDASSLLLPPDLVTRLTEWNGSYTEDKLALESDGDRPWISQRTELLAEVRRHLVGRFEVVTARPVDRTSCPPRQISCLR
jgi:hypothetical protein